MEDQTQTCQASENNECATRSLDDSRGREAEGSSEDTSTGGTRGKQGRYSNGKFMKRNSMPNFDMNNRDRMQQEESWRLAGLQKLNQLSFIQIISSFPLFIAGVVTLVMALPHVRYPVFNFGPVSLAIMVFPMALLGLLATRKATENMNAIITTESVKCMIVCNFILSILCSALAGISSFYSFYVVDQCSDSKSEYYELCLPNSRANIGLSLVDGIVCLILLFLTLLGISHFCTYGMKLCFSEETQKKPPQALCTVVPGQSTGHEYFAWAAGGKSLSDHLDQPSIGPSAPRSAW